MKYSNETIRSAKGIVRQVYENAAKERDAARMARKMGQDSHAAKEVYRNMMASK